MISRMPSQKFGMATPATDTVVASRSKIEPRRTAARTPQGIEIRSATTIETSASSIVAGMRSSRTSETGRRWKKLRPKSPVRALPTKERKRSCGGRSSPRSLLSLAT
jgi:hypothetical protein